ncbi:MAG: hypothetical protein LBD20_00400 [Spirochaetaceae bacterium]|jgi:hypothetical protein|nr:hypothetical protein [Spirochaetaceae bacterium]
MNTSIVSPRLSGGAVNGLAGVARACVILLILTIGGCDAPLGTKKPGAGDNTDTKSSYPRIEAVYTQDVVYEYGDQIDPSKFSVLYQATVDSDPEELLPADGNGTGFLINGVAEMATAGKYSAGAAGKYGDFNLIFTSAEDPSAKAYEFPIFVVAKELDVQRPGGTDLQKLEVVRQPTQIYYDKDEPFNPHGMTVVAWYGSDKAGATIQEGGVPLAVPQPEIDAAALGTAKHGQKPVIKVSYTDGANHKVETTFTVNLEIKAHEILPVNGGGVEFDIAQTARTGSIVTLGIKVTDDYELEENGIVLDLYDKENQHISEYNGVLNELAPGIYTRKVAFVMPRNKVQVSARTLQVRSGLGSLRYTIGAGEAKAIPGFSAQSRLLTYNLAVPSDAATEAGNALRIQAGPLSERPTGSTTRIQILKKGVGTPLAAKDYDSGGDSSAVEVDVGALTAGQDHDYEVQVAYKKDDGADGAVRTYSLRVMKFAEGANPSVTYEYTGTYQVFAAPLAGYYRIQAWGGKGGNASPLTTAVGGPGGYVAGTIELDPDSGDANKKMPLYIYVGEAGKNWNSAQPYLPSAGGWNGGGNGGESAGLGGSGGGGATSISTVAGAWNSLAVLGNRIMVAGGGGGANSGGRAANHSNVVAPVVVGSIGGGIAGSPSVTSGGRKYGAYESYTALGEGEPWTLPINYAYTPGQAQPLPGDPTFGFNGQGFGQGGNGLPGYQPNPTRGDGYNGKGGGGGGWWGGRVSPYLGDAVGTGSPAGGGGGSNFISGHAGCQAVLKIITEFNFETGENAIMVYPADDEKYRASSGSNGTPVAGASPDLPLVMFTNTEMNGHYEVTDTPPGPVKYEPKTDDPNLNNGNGKVTITYLGTVLSQ